MAKLYKHHKKGAGRHVQLPEWLQASDAWASLRPGPRALYVELKRRFYRSNNGRIALSHRDAANALNVHRNTVGPWLIDLQEHGFIRMTQAPHLGPSGIGKSSIWALEELPTDDMKPARKSFMRWRTKLQPVEKRKPLTKNWTRRHKKQDTNVTKGAETSATVLKIVTCAR